MGVIALPPSSSLNREVTVKALNIACLNAGIDTNSSQPMQVRLKADIGHGYNPVYSAPITMNVKAYSLNGYLWVPGDYQGWNPAVAPKLVSVNATGIYEGYVNIPAGGSNQFKFTSDPDWGHTNYGWASSTINGNNVTGTLSTSGSAGNLFVPVAGYYLMKANTNTLSWSVTKTTWSVIGDGAAGWSTDVPMTFDAVAGVWKVTTTLNASGQIKFRANNDWAINLGSSGTGNGLKYDGSNLSVTGGSHTVILDLRAGAAYTYTIQ
jgi:hypothetical protein